MSRPFAKNNGKSAFSQINKPLFASDYIAEKKAKYTFCDSKYCYVNKNVYSQSNYMQFKNINNDKYNCNTPQKKEQVFYL